MSKMTVEQAIHLLSHTPPGARPDATVNFHGVEEPRAIELVRAFNAMPDGPMSWVTHPCGGGSEYLSGGTPTGLAVVIFLKSAPRAYVRSETPRTDRVLALAAGGAS